MSLSQNDVELELCPFCGATDKDLTVFIEEKPYPLGAPTFGFVFKKSHHIECECGIRTKQFDGEESLDEVVKLWNERKKIE